MSKYRPTQNMNQTFFKFKNEDKSNLTCVNRNVKNYDDILESKLPLDKTILTLAKQNNEKVRLLDVGCGECRAIDDLLSNEMLNHALEKADGISLNYFSHINTVKQKHTERFTYYHGNAENVLKEHKTKYHIILDVMGAFAYTANKIHLLKLYHQILEPNGIALIMLPYPLNRIIINDSSGGEYMDELLKKYPRMFKLNKQLLVLTKSAAIFPLSDYNVISFNEVSSINADLNIETLRQGNALWPKDIILRKENEPPTGHKAGFGQ